MKTKENHPNLRERTEALGASPIRQKTKRNPAWTPARVKLKYRDPPITVPSRQFPLARLLAFYPWLGREKNKYQFPSRVSRTNSRILWVRAPKNGSPVWNVTWCSKRDPVLSQILWRSVLVQRTSGSLSADAHGSNPPSVVHNGVLVLTQIPFNDTKETSQPKTDGTIFGSSDSSHGHIWRTKWFGLEGWRICWAPRRSHIQTTRR